MHTDISPERAAGRPEKNSGRLGLNPGRRREKKTNNRTLSDSLAVVNADRELLDRLYVQTKRRQTPAYEVVLLRKHEAYTAFGKEISAGECYPSSEQWGVKGFTYRTIEAAERRFRELTGNTKEVA